MSGKKKILMVDDETEICELLAERLISHGYPVMTAFNGSDAFKLFKKDIFDCVISDIRMPNGDGFELLENVKSLRPNTVVFLMTAYSDYSEDELLSKGATSVLYKPLTYRKLIEAIESSTKNR